MIRFYCQCGRQLQAAENYIGQLAACPVCGQTNIVPATDSPPRGTRINERGEILRGDPAEVPPGNARRDEVFTHRVDTTEAPEIRPYPTLPSYEPDEDAPKRNCPDAQTALILGVVGLFCCIIAAPIAIVYGARAVNQINQSDGRLSGKGQAIAGIVMGVISLAMIALQMLLIFADRIR